MTTPFAAFANAVLIFQLPIQVIENDALGNPQAITEDFVLKAYLKPAASNTRNVNPFDAGQDNVTGVEGRCVEPTRLPADIVPGVKAIATIGGVEGEFYLEATIPSAFGVDDVLGASLKGRFVTSVTWGEAL